MLTGSQEARLSQPERNALLSQPDIERTLVARIVGQFVKPPIEHSALLLIGLVMVNVVLKGGVDYLLVSFVSMYGVATLGLNLIFGVGGMLSIAQAALVAVGGYTTALLIIHLHWPFLLAALLGVVLASMISTLFVLLAAKVRTHYFVLVSLAVAEIVILIVTNVSITGGSQGLGGIPPMNVAGVSLTTPKSLALCGVVVLIVVWYLSDVFVGSRLGRAVFVASLNEHLAMTCGINIMGGRLAVAAVGGGFAGIAGVLYAGTIGYLDPSDFSVMLSLLFLVSIVVGGIGSNAWTVFAVIAFTYLNDGLSNLTTTGPLIYGLTIVVVLLVAPGGLASIAKRAMKFFRDSALQFRSGSSGAGEVGK